MISEFDDYHLSHKDISFTFNLIFKSTLLNNLLGKSSDEALTNLNHSNKYIGTLVVVGLVVVHKIWERVGLIAKETKIMRGRKFILKGSMFKEKLVWMELNSSSGWLWPRIQEDCKLFVNSKNKEDEERVKMKGAGFSVNPWELSTAL